MDGSANFNCHRHLAGQAVLNSAVFPMSGGSFDNGL
jgi:hypothetical protein